MNVATKKRKFAAAFLSVAVFVVSLALLLPEKAEAATMDISRVGKKLYAIEAEVTLHSTSGTGSHAKLVAATASSAVSFGLQYDQYSRKFPGQAAFMYENIASNAAGGQSYKWKKVGQRDVSYKILLTLNAHNGKVTGYVNGKKMGSVKNAQLKTRLPVTLRVEGAGRVDGDQVKVTFNNIKIKAPDEKYKEGCSTWGGKTPKKERLNKGLSADISQYHINDKPDGKNITIGGTITGLGGQDWDSAFDRASALVSFIW